MANGTPAVLAIRAWSRQRRFDGLHAVAVATVAFVALAFSATAASVFTLANTALPGVAYSSVVCGNFYNDGKTDVLLTGENASFNGICQVWQNQSNGVFTNFNAALPGISTNAVTSSAVAQGDFDNDGRPDLFITGFAGMDANHFPIYLSQIWRNLGNGTFTNIQAGLPGVDTGAVALGDFYNDGKLDVLLTGYSSTGAVAQVWRNLGNGTFTNVNAGLPGVLYSSVALGDYDNDGSLDILLTGTTNGFGTGAITELWHNLGNGTFTNVPTNLPGVSQGAVAWGDFNQDGRLDILLTGYTQTGAICQVWRNLGNGTFTNMNIGLPGVYQSSVAVADYDNDGKLDILLAGVNSQSNLICQVWRNTGNWVFTNINAGLPGIRSGSVAWADFDNDGRAGPSVVWTRHQQQSDITGLPQQHRIKQCFRAADQRSEDTWQPRPPDLFWRPDWLRLHGMGFHQPCSLDGSGGSQRRQPRSLSVHRPFDDECAFPSLSPQPAMNRPRQHRRVHRQADHNHTTQGVKPGKE